MKIQTKVKKRYAFIAAIAVIFTAVITAAGYVVYNYTSKTKAYLNGFDAGNIMSDFVMSNKNAMNERQINDFLHSKNPCNKKYDNEIKHYERKGYSYSVRGNRVLCMADDSFNGKSAAHIIYRAAQDYNVNPQVLITVLEKEQSLVTDPWPNHNLQYAKATGFGCPDTAACNPKYSGFEQQVRSAAAFFHEVLSGGWSNYPAYTTQYVLYSPDRACGGSNVYIQNRATSALYRYTPYQPNAAALRAGTGKGNDCSSHGNRNFYNLFTNWFGDAKYQPLTSNVWIPNGVYRVRSGSQNSREYLDIAGGGTANGSNVALWQKTGDLVQDWYFYRESSGLYSIKSMKSGRFLDVAGANGNAGANVAIWQGTGACAQHWALQQNGVGYRIVSSCGGMSLDVYNGRIKNGTNVRTWYANDAPAQRWYLEAVDSGIASGTYKLSLGSRYSNKYVDVAGGSRDNGANIAVWSNTNSDAQYWRVNRQANGLYTLQNTRSGKYLDVSGANPYAGANIETWQGTGACAQKWAIVNNGDGYSLLSSCSGMALDVLNGKINNGVNIRTWYPNWTGAQRVFFDSLDRGVINGVYKVTTENKQQYLDVSGAATRNGTNIEIWQNTNSNAQSWSITKLSDNTYTLLNTNSGKYLDVAGASRQAGANVEIWQYTGACAQKWKIQRNDNGYRLVSTCGNKSLDIYEGRIRNGTNVRTWFANDAPAQRWYLNKVSE